MDNYVLLLLLCLITFLLYLFRFEVANKLKIIDKPDSSRKIHKIPVPLLGGIIIFICYTISKIYFDLDVNFSLVKLISFLLSRPLLTNLLLSSDLDGGRIKGKSSTGMMG